MSQQQTRGFAFAADPSYAAHIRLTPELRQALNAAQSSQQPVSLRMAERQGDRDKGLPDQQWAVLTIGDREFSFSSAVDNAEIVQLPDPSKPGSQCLGLGSVRQKLNLQVQSLPEGFRVHQPTPQAHAIMHALAWALSSSLMHQP